MKYAVESSTRTYTMYLTDQLDWIGHRRGAYLFPDRTEANDFLDTMPKKEGRGYRVVPIFDKDVWMWKT